MRSAGIVLCGGESSRMGRAKAWLPWNGAPMVAHVVSVLRDVVDEVVVVSSAMLDLPDLDARVIVDREPMLGPLAGIREGLWQMDAERAYVCGTDSPFLDPAFVAALFSHGDAAAPQLDGFVQTLAAVYPKRAAERADVLLAQGSRRPLHLLEAMDFHPVPATELPGIDSTKGFNTPGEYLDAVRKSAGDATATIECFGRSRRVVGAREIEAPVGTLAEIFAQLPVSLGILERDELVGEATHDDTAPTGEFECGVSRHEGSREGPAPRVAEHFRVSLNGRFFVQDARIPVGPGERVLLLDAPLTQTGVQS